jgi:hypothetical protein
MIQKLLPGICSVALGLASASSAQVQSIPVGEIQPGMVGEGRTVFSGERIESFKVTILGVLRNYGPNQNMILAELEGGPLAHTGVIAGMSGSPVYVDGKLVGAIAYAFPFAKDPIAGITPFDEMVEATDTPSTRRPQAQLEFPLTAPQLSQVAPPRPAPIPLQGISLAGADRLQPHLGKVLSPITTPVSLVGFPQEAFDVVAPLLRQLGIEPILGGMGGVSAPSAPSQADGGRASLAPGDAVGVGLVTGDLAIVATGTVTHVDPATGNVYAFGHPLFNLGPIEYPMTRSDVHLVLPSLMNSFKLASSKETVGTWVQDRATAIKGVLAVRPRMIPMQVTVHTSRGSEKSYRLEIVSDELFSPVLAYASLVSILQTTERQFGSQTVKVSAWVETTDDRRIRIEDVFADQQAAVSASAMVAAPLAFLLTNDFQDVTLREIRVEVEASEQPQTARLVRAWLTSDEVSPGGKVELKVLLRSYRGDDMLQSVDLTIPPHIRSGSLRVMVADASTLSSVERREARQEFVPRDMEQLVRAINSLRKNNRLYVRLSQVNASGAIVAGEYLTSLPPSVLSVLESDESGSGFIPLASSTFWEHEIVTDYSVSGAQILQLRVTNR